MARIVYISQVSSTTTLHWSFKGNASCLRDYSTRPVTEIRRLTTAQVNELLGQPGNSQCDAPSHDVKDVPFWQTQISEQNQRLGLALLTPLPATQAASGVVLPPEAKPNRPENLVARFKVEVKPLIEHDRPKELAAVLESWRLRLACIKNYDEINHWDHDPAHSKITLEDGIGWTALMLEFSRAEGRLRFIDVGNERLDFALIGMDVNLGISSHFNLFRLGEKDYVKPDGLGLRRSDSSLCVLEVKGPKDVGDLYEATLQALCGALAVHAKRDMFLRLVTRGGRRRPAVSSVVLPESQPSLGLYVLVSKKVAVGIPDMDRYMKTILTACPCVREICHFIVDPSVDPTFAKLVVPTVFERA
jgi:hypothetical protein